MESANPFLRLSLFESRLKVPRAIWLRKCSRKPSQVMSSQASWDLPCSGTAGTMSGRNKPKANWDRQGKPLDSLDQHLFAIAKRFTIQRLETSQGTVTADEEKSAKLNLGKCWRHSRNSLLWKAIEGRNNCLASHVSVSGSMTPLMNFTISSLVWHGHWLQTEVWDQTGNISPDLSSTAKVALLTSGHSWAHFLSQTATCKSAVFTKDFHALVPPELWVPCRSLCVYMIIYAYIYYVCTQLIHNVT